MLKKQTDRIKFSSTFTEGLKIAIVRPDYHRELNSNLENSCRRTLAKHGVREVNITTLVVPGSWEIPVVVQKAARTGEFDGIVAFGIILRGETHHFDMIASEVGRALMQISLDSGVPVALEVLAVYDMAQAEARAGKDQYNKGIEGAIAVLKTIKVLRDIE